MARYMIADLVSTVPDHLVYLIQKGDDEHGDTDPQEVWIPIDKNGDYCGDGHVVTVSGEKPWSGTRVMFGKLVSMRRKRGEWPRKAAFQS